MLSGISRLWRDLSQLLGPRGQLIDEMIMAVQEKQIQEDSQAGESNVGGKSRALTPGSMPNQDVKPTNTAGSALETMWESQQFSILIRSTWRFGSFHGNQS